MDMKNKWKLFKILSDKGFPVTKLSVSLECVRKEICRNAALMVNILLLAKIFENSKWKKWSGAESPITMPMGQTSSQSTVIT